MIRVVLEPVTTIIVSAFCLNEPNRNGNHVWYSRTNLRLGSIECLCKLFDRFLFLTNDLYLPIYDVVSEKERT